MKTVILLFRIIVAILALVGLATVVLFPKEFFSGMREWMKQLPEKMKKGASKESQHEEVPRKDFSQQTATQQDATKQAPFSSARENLKEDLVKEQFVLKQEKFFGIYENLYLVAKAGAETPQCNLEDWNTRIQSLSGVPELKAYWNIVRSRPAEFLDFVYACGVVRDKSETIKATEQTRYCYFMLDGTPIETGRTYKVMQPCWTNGNVILEKGIINNI